MDDQGVLAGGDGSPVGRPAWSAADADAAVVGLDTVARVLDCYGRLLAAEATGPGPADRGAVRAWSQARDRARLALCRLTGAELATIGRALQELAGFEPGPGGPAGTSR